MPRIILIQSEIELIKEYLRTGTSSIASMSISQRRNFLKRMRLSSFFLNEDVLCLREPDGSERICVADDDTEKLNEILTSMHLPDHTGMKAMYMYSKRKYSGFKRERINNFVSNCLICRQHQPLRRISPIIPIISAHPWALVQMDCIDMRNYQDVNDGYGWIVNIIDCYSKFMFAFPVQRKTAECILTVFQDVVYSESAPISLQTDNGREFNNELMTTYLEEYTIRYIRGRPRHPRNQGQIERANQTLVRKMARALSNNPVKRWISVIKAVVFKYNTLWNRSINTSPMEAFRGRTGINVILSSAPDAIDDEEEYSETELVGDLENLVLEPGFDDSSDDNVEILEPIFNEETVSTEYKEKYVEKMQKDADVHYFNISFNPGETVLLEKSFDNNPTTRRKKLDGFYEVGTWLIIERVGSDNFKIQKIEDPSIQQIVCKNRLKKI